jgi:hypothetical protein
MWAAEKETLLRLNTDKANTVLGWKALLWKKLMTPGNGNRK